MHPGVAKSSATQLAEYVANLVAILLTNPEYTFTGSV